MAMAVDVNRRRFTADEYQAMGQAGILRDDDRVELIDGEVVAMSPLGLRHLAVVDRLTRHLVVSAGDRAIVRTQGAVRLDPLNEPEPDIALLRPRDDFYATIHAGPADILVLIEVADSSLRYDTTVKTELYARLGAAEYWIVDLVDDHVLRLSDAQGGRYRSVDVIPPDTPFAPRLLPSCTLTTRDVFGA
jgi:Uma2 family endonuclease